MMGGDWTSPARITSGTWVSGCAVSTGRTAFAHGRAMCRGLSGNSRPSGPGISGSSRRAGRWSMRSSTWWDLARRLMRCVLASRTGQIPRGARTPSLSGARKAILSGDEHLDVALVRRVTADAAAFSEM